MPGLVGACRGWPATAHDANPHFGGERNYVTSSAFIPLTCNFRGFFLDQLGVHICWGLSGLAGAGPLQAHSANPHCSGGEELCNWLCLHPTDL
jgi:hypothetical protein